MIDLSRSQQYTTEELLGRLADEFTNRLERGENPDIEEYARAHPEMAVVLRQVLPALRLLGPPDGTAAPDQSVGGHAYGWVYPGPMGSILTSTLRHSGAQTAN